MKNLRKIRENLYELKIEDMVVQMEYAKTTKKLDECLLNILKLKTKQI